MLLALVTVAVTGCSTTDTGRAAEARLPASASAHPSGPSGSTSGGPSTGAAPSSPGTTGGDAFTLAATGDLLVHGPVAKRALANGHGKQYDFRPMLAEVRPIVAAADLALCHVETPLSADDTNISGYPVFNTPHEVADADAWAGYDGARPPRTIRSTVASRASGTPSGRSTPTISGTRARRAPRQRRGA